MAIRIRTALAAILLVIPIIHTTAQHIPGVRWMERETARFRIIYPETMSKEAGLLALALDDAVDAAADGLDSPNPHAKWPLVLTDLGVEANGFVGLAPRRSVWFAAPGEEFTAVSDWWMLLAHHEGRHIAQFEAADQGSTRALRMLFGDLGWGAGIVMAYPTWLLEGDAVVVETALSDEGRGRDPLFTRDMEALLAAEPDIGLHRAANPSYRRPIPDPYQMGYALVSWIRREYGEEALAEIYRRDARFPFPVIGLYRASRKATGKTPAGLFDDMAMSAINAMKDDPPSPIPGVVMTPEPVDFPEYDTLLSASDGSLYARKTTMASPPRLVRLSAEEGEVPLIRLPSGGRVSMAETAEGYRVAWNAVRNHPVQPGVSVSDITVVDLDHKGRPFRRRTLAASSRYLDPALSPDGSRLAVVELSRGPGCIVTILDAVDGHRISDVVLDEDTAASPSWSPDGEKLVFSARNARGRRIVEWRPEGGLHELTETSPTTVKTPVYAPGGLFVLFSSNASGEEAIWAVGSHESGAEAGPPILVGRGAYGLTDPIPGSGPGQYYAVSYPGYEGEAMIRMDLDIPPRGDNPENSSARVEHPIPPTAARAARLARADEAHPERPYSPAAHALNVHSWGIGVRGNAVTLGIHSDDALGTLSMGAGGFYDPIDIAPGAYTSLLFTGMRPIFGIDAEYRYRSADKNPSNQAVLSLGADYPMVLSRSGIWDHRLNVGAASGLIWRDPNGREEVLPVAFYDLDWRLQRPGSFRAFRPELGIEVELTYGHVPVRADYEDVAAARVELSLPGAFPLAALTLAGEAERRTADFVPQIRGPRGYAYENPCTLLVSSVDYEFPLAYPDWPVGSLIFLQRFRMGLFSDFGFTGPIDAAGPWEPAWSSGCSLTVDFAALNSYSGFSLGFRLSWLWQQSAPSFDILLMDLPIT